MPLRLDLTDAGPPSALARLRPRTALTTPDTAAGLLALWHGLFAQLRARLRRGALRRRRGTDPQGLGVLARAAQLWEEEIVTPGAPVLAALYREGLAEATDQALPEVRRTLGVQRLVPDVTDVQMQVAQAATLAMAQMTASTMRGARLLLSTQFRAGASTDEADWWLTNGLGLTWRQFGVLLRVKDNVRLVEQSWRSRLAPMLAVALGARLLQAAQHQRRDAVQLGRTLLWGQADSQAGETGLRRFWDTTSARPCAVCVTLASAHPEGLVAGEAFQGGGDAFLRPPAHVNCHCVLRYSTGGAS